MADYKAIFDGIEQTLFDIGSRRVPREQIKAELDPWKNIEGRCFTDDECYRTLVHIPEQQEREFEFFSGSATAGKASGSLSVGVGTSPD